MTEGGSKEFILRSTLDLMSMFLLIPSCASAEVFLKASKSTSMYFFRKGEKMFQFRLFNFVNTALSLIPLRPRHKYQNSNNIVL
jgi:hypothetical protein